MKERPDERRKKEGVDRRSFLRGAASFLGVQATAAGILETYARGPEIQNFLKERARRMRFEHWQDLSAKEREEHIEAEVAEYSAFVRSPEGHRILETGTDEEIFNLLYLAPPVLREHIVGTKYDITKENWPSVVVPSPDSGLPMTQELGVEPRANLEKYCIGNAVYVDERTFLSNWHVMRHRIETTGDPRVKQFNDEYDKGIDALYVQLPESATPPKRTFPLTAHADADIHGKFVAVAGIDPNESSADDGTKIYPAVAIRITKRLETFLADYNTWPDNPLAEKNSFLYIAPPGETISRRFPSITGSRALDDMFKLDQRDRYTGKIRRYSYMHGTSGSPVLMNGELAGLNSRLGEIEFRGRGLDIGFFLGPDALRKAKADGMVWQAPESIE